MNAFFRSLNTLCLTALSAVIIVPLNAYAQGAACDANFWTQIVDRSHTQASQDTTTGQTLIRRPDSVLEYSCFDQLIAPAYLDAGPVFSENDEWAAGGEKSEIDTATRGGSSINLGSLSGLSSAALSQLASAIGVDPALLEQIASIDPAVLDHLTAIGPENLGELAELAEDGALAALGSLSETAIEAASDLGAQAVSEISNLASGTLTTALSLSDRTINNLGRLSDSTITTIGNMSPSELRSLSSSSASSIADSLGIPISEARAISALNSSEASRISELGAEELSKVVNLSPQTLADAEALGTEALNAIESIDSETFEAFNELSAEAIEVLKDIDAQALAAIDGLTEEAMEALGSLTQQAQEALAGLGLGSLDELGDALGIGNLDIGGIGTGGSFRAGATNVEIDVFQGEDAVDNAVETALLGPLENFINSNFSQEYISGSGTGLDNNIQNTPLSDDSINCTTMQQVWDEARCKNFNQDGDDFARIGDFADTRPGCGDVGISSLSDANLTSAYETYLYTLDWRSEDPEPECENSVIIETGRKVIRVTSSSGFFGAPSRSEEEFDEKICLLPGCYYDYSSDDNECKG